MNTVPTSSTAAFASVHEFNTVYGLEIPLPALARGWLHVCTLEAFWDVERISAHLENAPWFSYQRRDPRDLESAVPRYAMVIVLGISPEGGFIELKVHSGNPLEDRSQSTLTVFAESPAFAARRMGELLAGFQSAETANAQHTRIGILNMSYGNLAVERIPVTSAQLVPREQVDLYYRDGMTAWTDRWVGMLHTRRYGLTILTGPPGTGKTTLLRSLAHWLRETHVFYFMPAARFGDVESGELVTFWINENRNSQLRKILILEDAESVLLRRDNENREKVATLLNLTDGMLGDALGLHVVATLNSGLNELDPALLRPGRLVAHHHFDFLNPLEAARLASALGRPVPAGEQFSLAEFFHAEDSGQAVFNPGGTRRAMGFHASLQT